MARRSRAISRSMMRVGISRSRKPCSGVSLRSSKVGPATSRSTVTEHRFRSRPKALGRSKTSTSTRRGRQRVVLLDVSGRVPQSSSSRRPDPSVVVAPDRELRVWERGADQGVRRRNNRVHQCPTFTSISRGGEQAGTARTSADADNDSMFGGDG